VRSAHCPDCGSEEVTMTAWVDANTLAIQYSGVDGPLDRFGCIDCDDFEFRSLCDCDSPESHSKGEVS